MPTYAYACTACDHRFEVQQSFTDESLSRCPQCEGRLRKLFNAVGIVFKGSGFYRTDSRGSGGSGTGAPAASETSPSAGGKDTAKATSDASGSSSSSTSSTGSASSGGSSSSGGSAPAASTSAA